MGGMSAQRLTMAAWVLAALLGLALIVDAALLWRAQRANDRIAAYLFVAQATATTPTATQETLAESAPELHFARAHALAVSGATEAALNLYRALQDDPRVGAAARFNAANLLLRQALVLRAGTQPGQAVALIELAKEGLRDLLRHDPQHWDARYNLERAQRLLPDPDEADDEPPEAARDRERAATTMRGVAPGLP